MAISLVSGGIDLGRGALGVTSVTFSNITPISGDLLVVCIVNANTSNTWPTLSDGWAYATNVGSGGDLIAALAYKVSDGTETGLDLGDIGAGVSKLVALQFEGNAASSVLDDFETDTTNIGSSSQTCSTGTATATQADGAAISFTAWDDQRFAEYGTHSLSNSFTILSSANPTTFPNSPSTTDPHPVVGFLAYSSTGNYSTTDTTTDTGDANIGIIALFKAGSSAPTVTLSNLEGYDITASGFKLRLDYDFA